MKPDKAVVAPVLTLGEALDFVFRVAAGKLGDDGQLIDAVLAKPDDVEGAAGGRRQREGNLHAGDDASTRLSAAVAGRTVSNRSEG